MTSSNQGLNRSKTMPPVKLGIPDLTKQIGSLKFTAMTVSKWLNESEKSVFCNVMETGDIVEVQQDEYHHWGIGIRTSATRTKDPDSIQIVSYKKGKVVKEKLEKFWIPGSQIRINNKTDKTLNYHSEEVIKQQIEYALKYQKKMKWNDNLHFAQWCRHGEKAIIKRQHSNVTDVAKWGSLTATAGAWMFMKNRRKRCNTE